MTDQPTTDPLAAQLTQLRADATAERQRLAADLTRRRAERDALNAAIRQLVDRIDSIDALLRRTDTTPRPKARSAR